MLLSINPVCQATVILQKFLLQHEQEKNISVTLYYGCMLREMLRKETRAVKLVFLQWVKEVTTDGADVARQPTDIQYWFTAFSNRR